MKKFLALVIAAVMCISIFTFNAHPYETIAQAIVNENDIPVMNSNIEPIAQSVNLEGINAASIKQTDVTEYYKNQDSITNLLSTTAPAPVGTTLAKTYGGSGNDWACSIQQTSDGGYIVAGHTKSFGVGDYDILIIKLDANGAVSWAKTYGGSGNEEAYSIQQTSDGGYIVAGHTKSFGVGDYDLLVIKLDADGTVDWAKTYGGSSYDEANSIQQTSDGGYIVAGHTWSFGAGNTDILIIKLDANGAVSWAKTYGGSLYDYAFSIQQTSDGGYIVAGYTNSFGAGNNDLLVIKLYADGTVDWAKTYGGSGNDWAYSIQQTSDGGYIVAGYFGAGGDFLVIKLYADGTVDWAKTYGGSGNEEAYSIQQTSDGYIVSGHTDSFGAGGDFLVIKLDANGAVSWAKTYGGSSDDEANSIQQTSDGGYIVAGYTWSFGAGNTDILIIKLDANGEIGGSCSYLQDCSPAVASPTVTVTDPTLTDPPLSTTSPEGLEGIIADVDTGEPDIQSDTICEGSVVITATAGPGGTITPSGAVVVNYGAEQAFTITPDPGYFLKDILVDGVIVFPVWMELQQLPPGTYTYTFENVTSNHTIHAVFAPGTLTYTITPSVIGTGGIIEPSEPMSVPQFGSQSFTITPDEGHKIKDIKVDGTSLQLTEQQELGPYEYTFTVVTDNHTISAEFASLPVISSSDIQGPYPSNEVKEFSVTTENPSDGESYAHVRFNYVIKNILLSDIVSFEYYDGTNWQPMPTMIQSGTDVTGFYGPSTGFPMPNPYSATTTFRINIKTPEIYQFIITLNDLDADNVTLAKLESSAQVNPAITSSANAGGTIAPLGAVPVEEGEDQSFTITPDINYHIYDVLVDGNSVGAVSTYTFTNVTSNHTIHAVFAPGTLTYTITPSVIGTGGIIEPSEPMSVPQFGSKTFTITPDTNYHIYDVLVDGASVLDKLVDNTYTFENVSDNHTIDAYFEHNYFKTTSPVGTEVFSPTDTINVTWDVEGFTGTEGKIRVLFYNGSTWSLVASNLDLSDGSFDITLSDKTIVDPLRCRVRVGAYDPATGAWLTWGTNGQYYDESGHFWVIDPSPTVYFKTTYPVGTEVFSPTDTINVTWDVEGFTGTEGKIRVLFYNGSTWSLVASNLDLSDGSYDLDLTGKTISDPLRCRVRVGAYDPATGAWLTWGTNGQYYDESGHFWVIPYLTNNLF